MQPKHKNLLKKLILDLLQNKKLNASAVDAKTKKLLAEVERREKIDPVVKIDGTPITRKSPRQADIDLLKVVSKLTGCEVFYRNHFLEGDDGNRRWFASPIFVGVEFMACFASHTWDVTYREMQSKRKELRTNDQVTSLRQIDDICSDWVKEVDLSLVAILGQREITQTVAEIAAQLLG